MYNFPYNSSRYELLIELNPSLTTSVPDLLQNSYRQFQNLRIELYKKHEINYFDLTQPKEQGISDIHPVYHYFIHGNKRFMYPMIDLRCEKIILDNNFFPEIIDMVGECSERGIYTFSDYKELSILSTIGFKQTIEYLKIASQFFLTRKLSDHLPKQDIRELFKETYEFLQKIKGRSR